MAPKSLAVAPFAEGERKPWYRKKRKPVHSSHGIYAEPEYSSIFKVRVYSVNILKIILKMHVRNLLQTLNDGYLLLKVFPLIQEFPIPT